MFWGVAGSGWAENSVAASLKRMMRKLSVGRSRRSAARMKALLASMGRPSIEPEQSSTNTISRGVTVRFRRDLRRFEQQAEEAAALIAVGQQSGLGPRSRQGIAQHEIAVVQGPAVGQAHLGAVLLWSFRGDRMGAAFDDAQSPCRR